MNSRGGSCHQVWDEAAATYNQHRREDAVYQSCVEVATRAVSRKARGIVLDAGCGTGLTTRPLLAHFDLVVATDYSLKSLRVLERGLPGAKLCCLRSDLRHLPFRDNSFHAVLCANVLQH